MVVIRKLYLPTKQQPTRSQRKTFVRRRADFLPPTPQPDPCVIWQGAVDDKGYGRFKKDYKTVYIHRWVVEQARGRKLTPKQVVLHACDNPPCFRLSHLSVSTVQDNNADMKAKGRAKPPPKNVLHGSANGRAKLTDRDVERVRRMWRQGLTAKTIAEAMGVSVYTIRRIVGGTSWKAHPVDLLAEHREKNE